MTNEELWRAILGELELNLSKANFTTWFKNTSIIEQDEEKITVAVPNAFTKAWLENKYDKFIIDALKNVSKNKLTQVFYKVTTKPEMQRSNNIVNIKQAIKAEVGEIISEGVDEHGLNPRYTFDKYIVGSNNELAHAAALAVTEKPGKAYNPLFIYGGVGLGKTHLLQAIGHKILKNNSKAKLLYVTSEKFTNEFINSVRSKKTKEFQKKYRGLDMLIVDDIQFIGGKEQTQEQMFHTFNDLHQNNKQIILSSDRTPKSIPNLEPRLESRFEWGMIVDISEPGLETKMAIIKSKLEDHKFTLNNKIIEFLANSVNSNIRELEGIINRIVAHSKLVPDAKDKEIDLNEVKNIIQTINLQLPKSSLTAKKIVKTVASFYEIQISDVTGVSRKKELVVPRQIIMYLMREEAKASFPNIGQEMGGRDHTTAMHAYSKIKKEIEKNDKIKNDIILIKQKLFNE